MYFPILFCKFAIVVTVIPSTGNQSERIEATYSMSAPATGKRNLISALKRSIRPSDVYTVVINIKTYKIYFAAVTVPATALYKLRNEAYKRLRWRVACSE